MRNCTLGSVGLGKREDVGSSPATNFLNLKQPVLRLRRALTMFAMTGRVTLTASALMALALIPSGANAEEKTFTESVIIEADTTIPAGDTYNYNVSEENAYNPIPGDLLEEPNSGLILNNGTLTIAGTANLVANFSSGSAAGDVSNLVIQDGAVFNVSRYSHMARHKDSVSNLTIEAGGTMNQTKSFYFGCRGESNADIYGTLNITDGNFHVGANYSYADETFRNNAVGIVTVHEGGVVNLTGGSSRHISLGRFGSVNTTEQNVGILNIDGGTVTAPSISSADDSGLTDKYTDVQYSHAEINITNGGTLNVGNVMMPYGTGHVLVDGAGSALNVTTYLRTDSKDVTVSNGGTINAATVTGGYAQSAFTIDGGTANVGTFSNTGSSANGGGLVIQNGGLLNLTASSAMSGGTIDISSGEIRTADNSLSLTNKTLNYSGGTLPAALNLTKSTLNISNTADWNVTSVTDADGSASKLNVTFTPDGSGTLLAGTTFTGFEDADVTLTFASGVSNQRLVSYTVGSGITYTTASAGNLVLNRGGAYASEANSLSGFAPLQAGDVIEVTANVTETAPSALPAGTVTLRSNSVDTRTISVQNGNLFTIANGQTSTLTAENVKFTGGTAENGGLFVTANASSYSDEWEENGVRYRTKTAEGGSITLSGSAVYSGNAAENYGGVAAAYVGVSKTQKYNTFWSGTGTSTFTDGVLTVTGSNVFESNTAKQGGCFWAGSAEGDSYQGEIVISGSNTFTNNTASNAGGVAYSRGDLTVNGTNTFSGNSVTAANTGWAGSLYAVGSVFINGENVFSGNSAYQAGAVYGGQAIEVEGANTFSGNVATDRAGGALNAANVTVTGTGAGNVFEGNEAHSTVANQGLGGAINAEDVTLEGTNTFLGNSADHRGGAIYGSDTVILSGDDSSAYFDGNAAGGVPNDIQFGDSMTIQDAGTYYFGSGIKGTYSSSPLSISEAEVTFGGGSVTSVGSMSVTDGADVTFQSGAKLAAANGVTVDGATFNLEGGVDFEGTLTLANTTANFTAGPGVNGFSSITADAFSGTVNVELAGFTVGAVTGDAITLIDGVKADTVNISNSNLMALSDETGKTAVTLSNASDGSYGAAAVTDAKFSIFAEGETEKTVEDFSLLVDTTDIQDFAEWMEETTGLETVVGTGYVNVKLDTPFDIMSSDSFVWDFSGYGKSASLKFATVNTMSNAVPEPSTWALLLLGTFGIIRLARRRQSK